MIIKIDGFDSISIPKGKVHILMTDNQGVYFRIIQAMQGKTDALKIFDDSDNNISLTRGLIWDGDPITNEEWIQRGLRKLIKQFNEELFDEERQFLASVMQNAYSKVQESLFKYDLPVEVKNDGDCNRMLKYCRPHFPVMLNKSAYDIISTDIKLHEEIHDTAVIGMSNVANYLTSKEFRNLIELVNDERSMLFLVMFSEKHNLNYYSDVDITFIDDDFVEWHL